MARRTTTTPTTKSKPRATPVKRASRSTPKPPSLPGEKRVRETDASIPVKPARRPRGKHDGPTDPTAIDRRRQVIGTDELPGKSASEKRR